MVPLRICALLIIGFGPQLVFANPSDTFVFGGYLSSKRYAENIDRMMDYQSRLDPSKKVDTVVGYFRRADAALSEGFSRWGAKELDKQDQIISHFSEKFDLLKPGANIRFMTTGHGFEPDDGPAIHRNATVGLDKLSGLFKKNSDKQFRILSTQCYSGSMHQIAFENNNVCVSASTDRRTPHFNPVDGTAEHQSAFLKASKENGWDLDNNGQISMYERHLAGIQNDTQNYSRADLSSNAYIDFITKSGPYGNSIPFNLTAISTYARPEAVFAINFYKENIFSNQNCSDCSCEPSRMVAKSVESIKDIFGSMIEPKAQTMREIQTLPIELRKIYAGLLESKQVKDLVSNEKTTAFIKEYSNTLNEWNNFKALNSELVQENEAGRLLSGPRRNDPDVIAFIKNLNTFEDRFGELNKRPETKIFNLFKTLQSFNKIIEFQKTATSLQKEKFNSLIKCELGEF